MTRQRSRSLEAVSPEPALRSCLDGVAEAESLLADVRRRLSRLSLGLQEEHLRAVDRAAPAPAAAEPGGQANSTQELCIDEAARNVGIEVGVANSSEPTLLVNREPASPTLVAADLSKFTDESDRKSRLQTFVMKAFQDAKEVDLKAVTHNADHVVIGPGPERDLVKTPSRRAELAALAHLPPPDVEYKQACGCIWLPMLHPEGQIRLIWVFAGFIFILYECFSLPFVLAFDENPTGFFFGIASIINVYFLCDVPLCFRTGYQTNEGHTVMDQCRVATKYARTWLLLDMVASIPWEWLTASKSVVSVTRGSKGFRLMRISRALRLVRLVRLFKLKVMMDSLDGFIEANQILVFLVGIVKLSFGMAALTHWGACIWYAIGSQDTSDETWVKYYLTGQGYDGVFQQYVWSVYFTLTTLTTVGFGDITPRNFHEMLFTLFLLMNASVLFAGMLGVLTDLISSLNRRNRLRMERKNTLSHYMRWRKLPRKLKVRIRAYLLFLWDTKETYEAHEETIMSDLTPVLRSELSFHIFGRALTLAPFLSWAKDHPICLKYLACYISCTFLDAGDSLFRIGDPSDRVHLLLSGSVWLTRNTKLEDDAYIFQETAAPPVEKQPTEQTKEVRQSSRTISLVRQNLQLPRHNTTVFAQVTNKLSYRKEALKKVASLRTSTVERVENVPPPVAKKKPAATAAAARCDFDSHLLRKAYDRVQDKHTELQRAALKLQRKWRARMETKKQLRIQRSSLFLRETAAIHDHYSTINKRIAHMPSRTVEAPAYFGESCLWLPVQEWETSPPVPRTYLAKCMERSETLCIMRTAVKTVLDQFHPWLPDRFEEFRQAVVEGLAEMDGASLQCADQVWRNCADQTPSRKQTQESLWSGEVGESAETLRETAQESKAEDEAQEQPTAVPGLLR